MEGKINQNPKTTDEVKARQYQKAQKDLVNVTSLC